MDHQPHPGIAGRLTTDRQPTEKQPARETTNALQPAALTWTRARLRDRIQQAGAALDPAAQPTDRQTCEMNRSPLADREPEP
jgi:hypothetical protein